MDYYQVSSELLSDKQWTTIRQVVDCYQTSSGLLPFLLTTVSAYRHIKGTVARYLLRNLTIFRDTTPHLIGQLYERVTILPPLHHTKYPFPHWSFTPSRKNLTAWHIDKYGERFTPHHHSRSTDTSTRHSPQSIHFQRIAVKLHPNNFFFPLRETICFCFHPFQKNYLTSLWLWGTPSKDFSQRTRRFQPHNV